MRLSNNLTLPTLPALAARSTWAIVLMAIITMANAFGIDLMAFLAEIGAGNSPEAVIATGERVVGAWQIVAPLILGIWAWIERRAPNFRLVFWKPASNTTLGLLGALTIALALLGGSGRPAMAQATPQCGALSELMAKLFDRFGEALVASFTVQDSGRVMLLANPETGSWTMVVRGSDDKACIAWFGTDWIASSTPPPGDPT